MSNPQTPMCDKLSAERPRIQAVLQFLEWLHDEKEAEIAVRAKDGSDRLYWIAMRDEQLVYDYVGIDGKVLEKERRALLASLRHSQGDTAGDDAPKE